MTFVVVVVVAVLFCFVLCFIVDVLGFLTVNEFSGVLVLCHVLVNVIRVFAAVADVVVFRECIQLFVLGVACLVIPVTVFV